MTEPDVQDVDVEAIRDAYVYLLGRALVVRQERADVTEDGLGYNAVKHNPAGEPIGWVNPNLDVTNSEAWVGVDQHSPALLTVPEIEGRYYTAQVIDEWGEVITNINERNYPTHPSGSYALVAPGATDGLPHDAVRIELRSSKAKILVRVEIARDLEGAKELQHGFSVRSLGTPDIPPTVELPDFDNATLLGVEIFDHADALVTSAPDVSPRAAQRQATVHDVAALAADPAHRDVVDRVIRDQVVPEFRRFAVQDAGTVANNWVGTTTVGNFGEDVEIRTAASYVGIWNNARHEVIYFVTARDASGEPLDGSRRYRLHFDASSHPDHVVDAYWSLSLVDVPGFLAVPNRLGRYSFNSVAPPPSNPDGSLDVHLAADASPGISEGSWLPSPAEGPFSLTFRTYVPKDVVKQGGWFPPAVEPV